ncbi:MAG: 30S ribosome-binding factor RbfA, partial [Candidatus Tectomicrobia bacterium]|nr:30S ribosome-binding factor RbfA [Candidatus Tectomicrobia bacterium]
FKRTDRLNELVKKEICELILREIKDPRIGFVTLTRVVLSKDLRQAKVYVSIYGKEEEKKATYNGLRSAAGFIRGELGKRLNLRYTPEIDFILDPSIEYGSHISQLLDSLKQGEE